MCEFLSFWLFCGIAVLFFAIASELWYVCVDPLCPVYLEWLIACKEELCEECEDKKELVIVLVMCAAVVIFFWPYFLQEMMRAFRSGKTLLFHLFTEE